MCEPGRATLEALVRSAHAPGPALPLAPAAPRLFGAAAQPAPGDTPSRQGSRRRRLWELGSHAHCPVIGVCLPIAQLRRLIEKVDPASTGGGDYELHCTVVSGCKRRTRLAELVQKELDRRYAVAVRQAAHIRTPEQLLARWRGAAHGDDLAATFWACLTHPRCDTACEERVLGDVHMLQHQVGAATRVDHGCLDTLRRERDLLAAELAALRQRGAERAAAHHRRLEAMQAELLQLRGDLQASHAALHEAWQALQARRPEEDDDAARRDSRNEHLAARLQAAQGEAERLRAALDAARRQPRPPAAADTTPPPAAARVPERAAALPQLQNRSVLCVGGRASSVPLYRRVIEGTGGRFVHHDGGAEHAMATLNATLAAADMVICQTGCISHDAYWRVKDHCKRTGKRCLFVETPSRAALQRALAALPEAAGPAQHP